jgi:hypothetical protein
MRTLAFGLAAVILFAAAPAFAGDYKCSGTRLEKSSSTVGSYRESGSDYYLEKSSSTIGKVVKRGSKWAIEIASSTVATYEGSRIEKGSSTWAQVSEATSEFQGCPEPVAVGFWVMKKEGKL